MRNKKAKTVNLDEVPDLIAKFLSVLSEEAIRICELTPEERTPQDINICIKCVTSLTALHKDVRDEAKEIRQTIRLLQPTEVKAIIDSNTKRN